MNNSSDNNSSNEIDDGPALARVPPHSELHRVVVDLLQVLPGEQPVLDLLVLLAVVEVKQQEEVRRRLEDRVAHGERTAPDFLDHVLGVLAFQERENRVLCDQVESVALLDVLFEQQEAHLGLAADLHHVAQHQVLDFFADVDAADLELLELLADECEDLDEQAAGFDDVEVGDKEVELARNGHALVDGVKESASMSECEVVQELSDQEGLVFDHACP